VAGNLVSMALRMASGVLQGRLVPPATLGLFNGIGLVLQYAPFLQLGILSGLNRELPYYVGKGDHQRVSELAAAAQAWAIAVGGVLCLILLAAAGWELMQGEPRKAAAWLTNAILAVLLFYNTHYLQMTYRTSHDFARLAMVRVVEGVVGLVFLLSVVWLSFYGLCLRAVMSNLAATAILFYWRPVRVGPRWNTRHLKHLLTVGAPIWGVGILYSWWSVVNSTLVLRFAGVEGMGLYSMALLTGATIELVPSAVSQVLYPRMAQQYGRNDSVDELLRIAWKPMIITAAGLTPVIAVAWWLSEPVVGWVVPAYVGAVPAIKWGLLVPLVGCFGPVNSLFNVVRRQGLYVLAILLGMVCYGGSLMWLSRNGVSLVAFSQAMLVGQLGFMLSCYVFIAYLRGARRV
jgi:O-antigen/teichoic acid export membrane protein